MKAPRWFPLTALAVIAVLAVGLYKAKTDALRARDRIEALEQDMAQTERRVAALRAEAQMLESPARLEAQARERLDLEPGAQARAQDLSTLEEALPLRPEATP
jgi:cell division protein FtsL